MRSTKVIFTSVSGLALLVIGFVSVNIISQKLSFRFDVTQEKVFSLSEGTTKILSKLDRPITARLYFSRSLKELPPFIKSYGTRVEEVLNEYRGRSNGKLTVEVVDPKPDTEDEEWAQKYGIRGIPLARGDMLYFGVVFQSGTKEVAIPNLDPRREEFLEYDLSNAIVNLGVKSRVKIAIMSSLPMKGSPGFSQRAEDEPWALVQDLARNFDLEHLPESTKDISSEIKTLIVVHPKNLSEDTLYAIDQFVMGGGRLIVAVDPMSRIDLQMGAKPDMTSGQMPQVSSDLTKLFAAWNVEYDAKKMVGDPALATQINAGGEFFSYPLYMTLTENNFSKSSVTTGTLHHMMIAESGYLGAKKDSPYSFEPLIKTTSDSGIVSAENAFFMMPQDKTRELKKEGGERVLAALIRGRFKSAFTEKPKTSDDDKTKDTALDRPHKAEAQAEAQVIVIADTDLLSDETSVDTFRFGPQTMIRPRNDNLNFVFNAVDYLSGSEDLVAIRSKGRTTRPFTRVQEIQKSAQFKWQAEEERLTQELTELQKRLNDMQAKRTDNNRFALSTAQQDEIEKFREEERRIRIKRREVRKNLREDIEALGRKLVAINMLGMPALASLFGTWVFVNRSRRRKGGQEDGE